MLFIILTVLTLLMYRMHVTSDIKRIYIICKCVKKIADKTNLRLSFCGSIEWRTAN